jgi:hypothetical protein
VASSALFEAVVARLRGDATLSGLVNGEIHEDPAPDEAIAAGAFVTVRLETGDDVPEFGGTAFEVIRVLVKAVTSGPAGPKAAADRIDVLLGGGTASAPVTLTVAGFGQVIASRETPVRYREFDAGMVLWNHRGGVYVVEGGKA